MCVHVRVCECVHGHVGMYVYIYVCVDGCACCMYLQVCLSMCGSVYTQVCAVMCMCASM